MNDTDPLDPRAASLLDAERSRPEDDAAALDRIFSRVTMTIAGSGDGGGGATGGGKGGASAPVAATTATATAKIAAVVVSAFVAGIGVGAVGHATLSRPSPTASPSLAPAVASASTEPSSSSSPTPSSSPSPSPPAPAVVASASSVASNAAPAVAPPRPTTARAGDRDSGLARERVWIEQARMAMARGAVSDALAALDGHAREFPAGRLTEEREALAVHALAAAGRSDEAAARARLFRQRWRSSVFMPIIDRASPEKP
jgi:hypothetical protein